MNEEAGGKPPGSESSPPKAPDEENVNVVEREDEESTKMKEDKEVIVASKVDDEKGIKSSSVVEKSTTEIDSEETAERKTGSAGSEEKLFFLMQQFNELTDANPGLMQKVMAGKEIAQYANKRGEAETNKNDKTASAYKSPKSDKKVVPSTQGQKTKNHGTPKKSNRGYAKEDSLAVKAKSRWAEEFEKKVAVPERDEMKHKLLLNVRSITEGGKMDKCKWLHEKLNDSDSCYLGTIMRQILSADSGMRKICSLEWAELLEHDVERKEAIMSPVAPKKTPFPLNELGAYFDLFDGKFDEKYVNVLNPGSQNADAYKVSCKTM